MFKIFLALIVGILSFISTYIIGSENYIELDYDTIFKILRKYEYENIISKYYELPEVSQFKYYKACKELFKTIPLDKVYSDFKVQLKQRTKINLELIQSVPKEIKSVVYFSKLKETEYKTLETFLERKFGG